MTFHHVPVLLDAVLAAAAVQPGDTVVDATVGGGGHSAALLSALGPSGRLLAFDRDRTALDAARARLAAVDTAATVVVAKGELARLGDSLRGQGLRPASVDVLFADLGVSSPQLDVAERGFSFQHDGPLDMRMDHDQPLRAWDLVNDLPADALAQIFRVHGEEPDARRIARTIVERRAITPFRRTADLAAVVEAAKGGRRGARNHPATLVFQSLRIATNAEDRQVQSFLDQSLQWLRPGGRLLVLTFHSGEDRAVKQRFAAWRKACTCPADLPVCVCGGRAQVSLPAPHGWTADDAEVAANPRARSARLRLAIALPQEVS